MSDEWKPPTEWVDPVLALIAHKYRSAFRTAFHESVGALSAREKTVLRLHLTEGLPVDSIGTMYGVHRATVARWVQQARQSIADEARRRLAEKVPLLKTEVTSFVRALRAQVSLSFSQLLSETVDE